MIFIETGDMFMQQADAIVNAVNCSGVMGAGIAEMFKDKYPNMFDEYLKACKNKTMRIGKIQVYELTEGNDNFNYILNFPTKDEVQFKSKLGYIIEGLKDLKRIIIELDLDSIIIPALGCGYGGLSWGDVKPLIFEYLSDLDIEIYLYEPK